MRIFGCWPPWASSFWSTFLSSSINSRSGWPGPIPGGCDPGFACQIMIPPWSEPPGRGMTPPAAGRSSACTPTTQPSATIAPTNIRDMENPFLRVEEFAFLARSHSLTEDRKSNRASSLFCREIEEECAHEKAHPLRRVGSVYSSGSSLVAVDHRLQVLRVPLDGEDDGAFLDPVRRGGDGGDDLP